MGPAMILAAARSIMTLKMTLSRLGPGASEHELEEKAGGC
jgi:hypothetical protein